MSDGSSPVNGEYDEATSAEPTLRLSVRKDLFPDERLSQLALDATAIDEELEVSCVKLETDFEQSIDDIAIQRQQVVNGVLPSPTRHRHRKHKQHSRRDAKCSVVNGCLSEERTKSSSRSLRHRTTPLNSMLQVKGGKNLNLVSSSECQEDADETDLEEEDESSEDEVLKCSVKLPLIVPRQTGKPYSHELSQLSTKKRKSKNSSKERHSHVVTPCSGKPRSMLGIGSSRSKKKSKKSECTATYRSQIVDTNTNIKIKIRRTSVHETITPASIADLGQRKSKKKRAASPVVSESSGEEYDPTRGDTAAAMSVAAPKPRQPRPKTRKPNDSKKKSKKTEKNRTIAAVSKDTGPQSPWAVSMPEEILTQIFEYVVTSQGTLPAVIRLGRVCRLWHSVSLRPELWKNVDLALYTTEKCKTDYKLVWLLENRLSKCQSLNIAQWKVCNVSWVLACVVDYCPGLVELSVAGWSRITPDQLFELVQGLPKLQRLDLSLTSETGGSGTCLSAASMARVVECCGGRLTHLTLANNKFTALPQILASVAAHCQNLEVLDISGAQATSHPAAVPLEALQKGCPKMRVFRAANSQLVLASATTAQQMEAVGWTQLEELSIAGEAAAERVGVGEYRLGDEAVARLVRGATRLRLLDLRGLQRLTDSGLVRVPAWDLQHLFLGGCNVTRQSNACLELICEKWSHSLIEIDLSWASAHRVLDDAVRALADSPTSRLRTETAVLWRNLRANHGARADEGACMLTNMVALYRDVRTSTVVMIASSEVNALHSTIRTLFKWTLNLCGSSVSLEPVKKVLLKCPHLESLNLSSCRALPRGMKRLYCGKELQDLKNSLDPEKTKTKEDEKQKTEKDAENTGPEHKNNESSIQDVPESSGTKVESKTKIESSVSHDTISESDSNQTAGTPTEQRIKSPVHSKSTELSKTPEETVSRNPHSRSSTRDATPKLLSPSAQSKPDSSSTPSSDSTKTDLGSPLYSPVAKPDSQVHNSPEIQNESIKSNSSWNLGQFKTTPTHKSEASPLNRLDSHTKIKHGKVVEQCSPTTSLENKPSPETAGVKQDVKTPNSWNYGSYSPMPRQDTQFSSQRSPYSAQPSPAQPSPYSTQPSPYSTQPSPYSSQPSPYSAQPSPDTSQMVKPDLQKSGAWNTGSFSPMPKHHAPFSPHPSIHTSPDAGLAVKSDALRSTPSKTPGQYSPMSRQDRIHQSPYSPRPSVENVAYNKKSPAAVGNYSPMMRPDCHLPSPDGGQPRPVRSQDIYNRPVSKVPDVMQNVTQPEIPSSWGMERFGQMNSVPASSIESLGWGAFGAEPTQPRVDNLPAMLNTPPAQSWTGLPPFDSSVRRQNSNVSDPWTLGEFRVEPPQQVHNTFVEQNVTFESLSAHLGTLQNYLDDGYTETSRVD